MKDDPFDGIEPIGEGPKRVLGVSRIEAAQRAAKSMAQRGLDRPPDKLRQGSEEPERGETAKPRKRYAKLIATPELERMVDTLLRKSFTDAKIGARPADRKHSTVAFGVLVDKKQVIRGKPTPAQGFAEAEAARPGMLALAKLIAEGHDEC